MTQPLAEIIKQHPIPQPKKFERRISRLKRMAAFYEEKAPDAPEKQQMMFNGFVSALFYAITLINAYQDLTTDLKELQEAENETRTDSTI